jgi:hypothetical protein
MSFIKRAPPPPPPRNKHPSPSQTQSSSSTRKPIQHSIRPNNDEDLLAAFEREHLAGDGTDSHDIDDHLIDHELQMLERTTVVNDDPNDIDFDADEEKNDGVDYNLIAQLAATDMNDHDEHYHDDAALNIDIDHDAYTHELQQLNSDDELDALKDSEDDMQEPDFTGKQQSASSSTTTTATTPKSSALFTATEITMMQLEQRRDAYKQAGTYVSALLYILTHHVV